MALRDIVIQILLALDPQAQNAFITKMGNALYQGTNPTKAKQNLGEVDNSLDKLTKSISKVRNLLLITFGGRIIANFIRGSIDEFLEFDKTLNRAIAVMDNVSDVMKNRLGAAALQLSKELNISAAEINDAYYALGSAGLNAEQSIAAIPVVAAFAKAGLQDATKASEELMTALNSMGYRSENAMVNMAGLARIADVLAKASTMSQGKIDDLTLALNNKAAPAFRILGKDIEEVVAGLAVLADQGRNGTIAGERLSIFMRSVANAALIHKSAWAQAGIAVYDSTGKMKNLADIVQSLTDYLGRLSPRAQNAAILQLGMSQRSIDATKAFIGQADAIRRYEEALKSSEGYVQDLAHRQMKSLAERLGQVGKQLTAARIEMGEAFVPVLERLGFAMGDENDSGSVIGQIRGFGQWIRNNSEIIGNFVTGALWLLIHGFEALFVGLTKMADIFVIFTTTALYPLVLGFELAVTGVSLFGHLVTALTGLLGLDGVNKWFDGFTKAVDGFGKNVDSFRVRMGEVIVLAGKDLVSLDGTAFAGDPRFKSKGPLVKKVSHDKSKSNAGTTGTDDSVDVIDKDAEKTANKLQALLDRLASMIAGFTDDAADDVKTRLNKLREGFEDVFGKGKVPEDILRMIELLGELGTQSDIIRVFGENMKTLKADERTDREGISESINSYVNLIDTMEAALPHIDKKSKAYQKLAEMVAEARKELERLKDKERKNEDDDEASKAANYRDWLDRLRRYSDIIAEGMARSWENVFMRMQKGMKATSAIWRALGNGILGTLFGGLGEYALKKAKENSLHAAEELVKGFAAAVDPFRSAEAPGHFAAAAKYTAIAAAWGAAAGGGSYEAQRLGGASSGPSDVGGKQSKNSDVKNIVNIYIDGVDPQNPRHQQLIGDTTREYMERAGTQVFTHPRRG